MAAEKSLKKQYVPVLIAAAAFFCLLWMPRTAYANPVSGEVGYLNCRCYAVTDLNVKKNPGSGGTVKKITAGQRMTILSQKKVDGVYYWKVTFTKGSKTYTGWVKRSKCLINAGDYDPDIIVEITNATGSLMMTQKYTSSKGYYADVSLSGITGKKLYGSDWESDEAPVTWQLAKKLSAANQAALQDGYALKIYDAYRPYSVSKKMSSALKKARRSSVYVLMNLKRYGFDTTWFASSGISAHNSGTAVDCTLVKVKTGKELSMPTSMHLLSSSAAIRTNVSGNSGYVSSSVTRRKLTKIYVGAGTDKQKKNAVKLNNYMTQDGNLYSLKSEWWHFQLSAKEQTVAYDWKIHD